MAFTKKMILFLIFLVLSTCFLYSQDNDKCFINDKGVRLRDEPGLNGKIIRNLDENEKCEYITAQDLFDGSDYKWINVKTTKETGWVYGEFVSKNIDTKKQFTNIEDAGIKTSKGNIYSGMNEMYLLQILGEPLSRFFDEDYNEDTLTYGFEKELVFLIRKYNHRIHHIIIKSKKYSLTNNVEIGMNISEIQSISMKKIDNTRYSCDMINLFRSSFFDTVVILTVDQIGIITEIQVGLPE